MATKGSGSPSETAATFMHMGQEQAGAAASLQKEMLEAYEKSSRAWLARMQSEVGLWSELAAKLASTRSMSEAFEAYTKCVSQQMQMTAEDAQHVINDYHQITQRITKSLSSGSPMGGT
jgi:Phasin protein